MVKLTEILKDKNVIKELNFKGELSSVKIVEFLIAFFENLVGVKLTSPEREFFLLTLQFLSEGKDISNSDIIPFYRKKLGVETNKTIYERRSGLVKKFFMSTEGHTFKVQDIFNPANYNNLTININLG